MKQKVDLKRKALKWAAVGCVLAGLTVSAAATTSHAADTPKQGKKPNILVIWGDDIGMWNVGAYTHGMMGRRRRTSTASPSKARFSPTTTARPAAPPDAPRSSRGKCPLRTGETTIGIPGSTLGIQKEDPTLAEVLKSQGYATAPVRQEPPGRPQ